MGGVIIEHGDDDYYGGGGGDGGGDNDNYIGSYEQFVAETAGAYGGGGGMIDTPDDTYGTPVTAVAYTVPTVFSAWDDDDDDDFATMGD